MVCLVVTASPCVRPEFGTLILVDGCTRNHISSVDDTRTSVSSVLAPSHLNKPCPLVSPNWLLPSARVTCVLFVRVALTAHIRSCLKYHYRSELFSVFTVQTRRPRWSDALLRGPRSVTRSKESFLACRTPPPLRRVIAPLRKLKSTKPPEAPSEH
jgi:hypothetical protein